MKLEHILVPVDFSKNSELAFAYVEEILSKFPAQLTLLHAVEPCFTRGVEIHELNAKFDEEQKVAAELRIRELAASLLPRFRAEAACVLGRPWVAICDWAWSHQVDLIVIPTHGYSGLEHHLMGSVAERVVQKACCPVLVVRPLAPAAAVSPVGKSVS